MQLFHISIGGGITGVETIISTINRIEKIIRSKKKINKKIIFGIVDKNPENIPGGVAYGFKKSLYGYFNNPLRLSPVKFTNWVLKKNNKIKLINYLKAYGGYTGAEWIKKNEKEFFSKGKNQQKEIYIPRALMNYWMEEKLIFLLKKIKKKKTPFLIKFFKGEVTKLIKQKKFYKIKFKNNKYEELNYKILKTKSKKLIFEKNKKLKGMLNSKNINVGLGLPPPKQIATPNARKNNNYIWDFYDKGSTDFLVKKILLLSKEKKRLKIYFIGFKAGLLESLPELFKIIIKNKINLKIICSSKELQSIQKAKRSNTNKIYAPKVFKKNRLLKINTSKKLYQSLTKEFKMASISGHNKYDAWTYILNNNIIYKIINNFDKSEKKKYDDIFHNQIRQITRFTYPETIKTRELMFKNKILEAKKEVVNKVDYIKGSLVVFAVNDKKTKKNYKCDLVVNVSGPLNAEKIKKEIPLINSIKNIGGKIIYGNLLVNNYFEIHGLKNVYLPGVLARGFNPERKTIINAILRNSYYVAKSITGNFIKKKI